MTKCATVTDNQLITEFWSNVTVNIWNKRKALTKTFKITKLDLIRAGRQTQTTYNIGQTIK